MEDTDAHASSNMRFDITEINTLKEIRHRAL